MDDLSDPVIDRSLKRFEIDVMEKVKAEVLSGRINDEGRVRSNIRKDLDGVFNNSLELHDQMKLILHCGKQLLEVGEYPLSKECFLKICDECVPYSRDNMDLFRIYAEAKQCVVTCEYTDIISTEKFSIAPMRMSRLLSCLTSTRDILDSLLTLSEKEREKFAWLILNCCKLLYKIGQPLLWLDCAKYVHESLIFASMSMDAVINLCTTRHLNFRMKICSAAFSAMVTHSSYEEVFSFVQYVTLKVSELRQREELDPPLRDNINEELMRAETDIAVLNVVMEFWHNPDSFDMTSLQNPFPGTVLSSLPNAAAEFAEKCLMECIRTQEMTASNLNEPWRKRTSTIIKQFMSYTENFTENEVDNGTPEEKNDQIEEKSLTTESLVSVLNLCMFNELEGVDNAALLERISCAHQRCIKPCSESELSLGDLSLLQALSKYIAGVDRDMNPESALRLVEAIHNIVHSNVFSVRRTLLRKLATTIWAKAIYPMLQKMLSTALSVEFPNGDIEKMIDPFATSASSLVLSSIEDPVLLGCISVTLAQLLLFVGKHRKCISFLVMALECIENHRAARVDIRLHYPDEISDTKALQHASFTCHSDDSHQWHASAKRLGAHAFAGYGIFGTASSMSFVDQALCDVHLDLLSLLFRSELSYAILGRSKYSLLKTSVAPQNATTKAKTEKLNESLQQFSMSHSTELAVAANVDKLGCITYLRSNWGKSTYARSVLLVEMARVEKKPEKKLEYLLEAEDCVREAEKRELDIQSAFSDLSVVAASTPRYPIVVARSHSFMYVAPVGCRKRGFDKADHFRVFGREEGSGTDVSVTSDELSGCDELIKIKDMTSPAACAVRISNLRLGEKYAFASAGFNKEGKIIGQISPTCLSVEAANPLPIVSLRANICQLAYDFGEYDLSNRMSSQVSDFYIKLARPKQDNRTFGKGINAFSYDRHFLNMLSVQQASPVQLLNFVKCFLAAEEQFIDCLSKENLVDSTHVDTCDVKLHWNFKSSDQIKIATNCHKLALVTSVAAMCQDHVMIVRCVSLGYTLISQSLLFDASQMAHVLLNPILVFLSALKVTPHEIWEFLDHQLYCRLVLCAVKCAAISGNTSSLTPILGDVFSSEKVEEETFKSLGLHSVILNEYNKLYCTFKTKAKNFEKPEFVRQMHELLSLEEYSPAASVNALTEKSLWDLTEPTRAHLIRNSALVLAQEENNDLTIKIREHFQSPVLYSQLLDLLVCSMSQLLLEGKYDDAKAFLDKFPIRKDMLDSTVSEACSKWCVDFVWDPAAEEEDDTAQSNNKEIVETTAPTEEANDYLSQSQNEILEQFRGIAHMCLVEANASCCSEFMRNDFPECDDGPYLQLSDEILAVSIDEYLRNEINEQNGTDRDLEKTDMSATHGSTMDDFLDTKQEDEEEQKNNISVEEANVNLDYVRRLSTAIILFVRSQYYQSAVDTTIKLWKFITDRWYSPLSFAKEFFSLKEHLLGISDAMIQLLERQCCGMEEDDASCQEYPNVFHPRTVKQNLFALRYPITFFIKCLCLLQASKDVVEIGLRVLDVYIHHNPEQSNIVCDHSVRYLLFSQERIIAKNEGIVKNRTRKLNSYIKNWEEMQAKRRKKKIRVVKVEKSDEELKFEAEKASLNDKLERAQSILEFSRQKKDLILQVEKRIDGANTSGQQIFDRVRKSSTQFIKHCRKLMLENPAQYPSFPSILSNKTESKKFYEITSHFDQVAAFLREKKDIINLVSALHEEGDFYLLFGAVEESSNVWRDGVDGYFNVLDAWKDWQDVSAAAVQNVNMKTNESVLTVIIILSKLSKHCSTNNMDLKSNYCQLAAKLCLIPFKETLNHPVDLHGFAAYNCVELGGKYSLEFNDDTLSSFSFHSGLEEIVKVLGSEKMYFVALPILVLWEHFHAVYTCRPDLWLVARLRRVQFLSELHYFSEATSMLATIIPSVRYIKSGNFADSFSKANDSNFSEASGAVMVQNVSDNGFDYVDAPPFYSNETVESERNQLSLSWLGNFPEVFSQVSKEFTVILPPDKRNVATLTEVEPVPNIDDKNKDKGKGKGKKVEDPPAIEITDNDGDSLPLFSVNHISEVYLSCALVLTELSSIDCREFVDHHDSLCSALTQAMQLTESASSLLRPEGESSDATDLSLSWNDAQWVGLYGKCRLLHFKQLIVLRKYKECRSCSLDLLKHLNAVSNVFCSSRFELTHLWLSTKLMLAETARHQGRFDGVISVSAQGSIESSSISSSFWHRRFLFELAMGKFNLGNMSAAKEYCDEVLESYRASQLCDVINIRVKLLSASILHANLQIASNVEAVRELYLEIISLLRSAVENSEMISTDRGFVGEDSNLTFKWNKSSMMLHDRFAPFVNGLTDMHVNYPDMTPVVQKTKTGGGRRDSSTCSPDDIFMNTTLRAGPVDVTDVYPDSPLCNLYLEEVKFLALSRTSLCLILDEFLSAKLTNGESDSLYSENTILKELIHTGEAALKTLRHVVYPSTFIKSSLFLSVGKSRTREMTARCLDGKFPGCEDFLSPLMAGIKVNMSGPHLWHAMKLYCLEIVECYGNQNLILDEDSSTRLKMAVKYLLLCARLDNIQFNVQYNSLRLLEEISLVDAVCPEGTEKILVSMSSSSLFSFGRTKDVNQVSSSEGAGATKGKAKGKEETVANHPGARDAFLILSALAREHNPFLVDGMEYVFSHDLVKSIRKSFPQTENRLFVSELPSSNEDLVVTEASITCVWSAVCDDGSVVKNRKSIFPDLMGYIVLGGLKEEAEDGPSFVSEEPLLRKVSVDRSALTAIRGQFAAVSSRLSATDSAESLNDDLAQLFCTAIQSLLLLLQGPYGNDEKQFPAVSTTISKPDENSECYVVTPSLHGVKVCHLNLNLEVVQQLIDFVTQEKSCYNLLCDKNVSLLFWAALRL